MSGDRRPGAVPGITVSDAATTAVGPTAIDYVRLCALVSALRLEVRTGLRMSRHVSALAVAKRDYNLRGGKVSVLAQLESLRGRILETLNATHVTCVCGGAILVSTGECDHCKAPEVAQP